MSGINVAWMYVGMKFSTFCWHFEDLMLPSINYNHYGKPKLWYGVPENNREKFDKAVREKCSLLFKKDPNILFDVITMISPTYLRSQGVKVYKTLQRPGEFVVTYPGSYHGGFSTGLNIGEAVNFTTMTWLKYGLKCQGIYRASQERIPVFPIEWILTENIRSLGKIQLSKVGLETIRNYFSAMLSDEIKSRKQMEAFLKDHYGSNDQESYKNHIVNLKNREQYGEDAFQCKYCTDLCYWSMIKCSVHTIEKSVDPSNEAKKIVGRCQMTKQEKRQLALSEA